MPIYETLLILGTPFAVGIIGYASFRLGYYHESIGSRTRKIEIDEKHIATMECANSALYKAMQCNEQVQRINKRWTEFEKDLRQIMSENREGIDFSGLDGWLTPDDFVDK